MTTSNDGFDDVLERVLAGDATDAERAQVAERAAHDPATARLLAGVRAAYSSDTDSARWNTDGAWAGLQARIHADRPVTDGVRDIRSARPRRTMAWVGSGSSWLRAAAVLFVVLGASLLWRATTGRRHDSAPAVREIATARAQRATYDLPDGTRVTLDVDSRLRLDVTRAASGRDVYLTGEAFFQVKHDATRPFRVHAAGSVTQVLGTEFGVRAYPGASEVFVAVRSGMVALAPVGASSDAGVRIGRGQLASIDATGNARLRAAGSAEQMLAWTSGRLVLSDVSVAEAAQQLGRWYDVQIIVDDSQLAERRVDITARQEPVAQALEALCVSLGARCTQNDSTWHITGSRKGS